MKLEREPLNLAVALNPGEEFVTIATVDGDKFCWNENATPERLKFVIELQYRSQQQSMARQMREQETLMAGLDRISEILKPKAA